MTKTKTIWMALLVLSAGCIATAEQPVVWYPAQQAQDSQSTQAPSGQAGQQPSTQSGQPQGGQQPSTQPGQQPGVQPGQQPGAQPGQQPAAPGTASGNMPDPRLDQPMQPIGPAEPAAQTTEPAPGAAPMLPDMTPLNSPQELTLGTPRDWSGRSSVTPSFRFSTSVNATSGIPGAGTEASGNMSATVVVLHSWARAGLNFNYTAGGNLYSSHSELNSAYQDFSLGLNLTRNHWSMSLTDAASYLPDSAFGFYGTQFLGGGSGLGTGYLPNQSILTVGGSRISNTVVGSANYKMSPKSSMHFSATWGILRDQGGGLTNDDNLNFGAGFDRKVGGTGTIGVSYAASLYGFGGSNQSVVTHSISLSYGRRVVGKLALQLGGGAEIRPYDDPKLGSATAVSYSIRSGLTYQVGRMHWSSSLTHYTSGGSGVLYGADTWQWNVGTGRMIGRQWNTGVNFGIARNTSLSGVGAAQATFNSQFVSVQISRILTRECSVFLNYNLQHQTSNFPICLGCGDSYARHMVGLGFNWQGRPMTGWF
ncbi:MAG: hypothetical protein LAN37_07480 [Acidobacteriia bacterium]|nr:hypothetical protein [Terriglobia bacterium]